MDINKAAREFIAAIASNMSEVEKPLASILNALEDGEALAYLGVTDDDQEMVEEAHFIVKSWMANGLTTLNQALVND